MRGCRDVFGAAAAARRALVGRFAALCGFYGFREVETPILERHRTFAAGLGATSDVIASEMFHLAGASDTVLRPEGTASVARALHAVGLAHQLPAHGVRVWYEGAMFRHERPQRLRLRQFTQLGVEVVGDAGMSADVDVIALAGRFLAETPAGKDARLVLNTLGGQEDRARFNDALRKWLAPRYGALSALSRSRFDAGNCMRVLDSKLSEDMDAMKGAPRLWEFLGAAELRRFDELKGRLREEGVEFKVDELLVRGLDYYTSTAFEFVNEDGQAVCAGGRYSNLLGLDGVGFAAGLERVEDPKFAEGMVDNGEFTDAVVVLPIDKSAELVENRVGIVARDVTRRLRSSGIRTVARLEGVKLGKQMSRAIKAGASAVVIVGDDDIEKGVVKVKVIDRSNSSAEFEQVDVALDAIVQFFSSNPTSLTNSLMKTASCRPTG